MCPGTFKTIRAITNEVALFLSGAGGLGCEILKDLAMSRFKNIHVIDMGMASCSLTRWQRLYGVGIIAEVLIIISVYRYYRHIEPEPSISIPEV